MKLTLGQKQREFAECVGLLIRFAYAHGYMLTFGDAYRDPRCRYGSKATLHRKRLAVDFNLFKWQGGRWRYQKTTAAHKPLGEYWESIGGSWGGRFKKPDGNHYSLEHNGVR